MAERPHLTRTAVVAAVLTLVVMAATAGFLISRYPHLTPMLPVHFRRGGFPDRWAHKSWPLVFMPVFIQIGLATIFGAIVAVLRWKSAAGGRPADDLGQHEARRDADDRRMQATAEAVVLLSFVWIGFQSLAAVQIVQLWTRGLGGLGTIYAVGLLSAIVLSIVIAARGMAAVRRAPVHVAADGPHWRLKVLYYNPADPALFVPAKGGAGYTLNFGRRAAIVLLAAILLIGIGLPVVIIRLLTHGSFRP